MRQEPSLRFRWKSRLGTYIIGQIRSREYVAEDYSERMPGCRCANLSKPEVRRSVGRLIPHAGPISVMARTLRTIGNSSTLIPSDASGAAIDP